MSQYEAEDGPKPREQNLAELLPDAWRQSGSEGIASAYRMLGIPLNALSPPFNVTLTEDVCVIMGWLGLPQLGVEGAFEHRRDGQVRLNIKGPEDPPKLWPSAPTAVFVTPIRRDSSDDDASTRIHAVVGLLSAVESLTLVHEHLEDYRLSFDTGMLNPVPVRIASTLWWITPSLTQDAQNRWTTAAAAASASPDAQRIALSLRWYDEAKRATDIDAFLRFWFALEILGMPDTTNVAPLRDALARGYGIASEEAEQAFGIGRIQGLRSRIVHDGLRVTVPTLLLTYLDGVYLDLLAATLGFAMPGRAQAALAEAGGLPNVLPAAVGGRGELAEAERAAQAMERLRPSTEV